MHRDKSEDISTLLRNSRKDKTTLAIIVDKIFLKNREGLFTHDLIWAFFQAKKPYSLMLIANYLGSEDACDVKLARELLNFVPHIDMTRGKDSKKQYIAFRYFLEENYPFLLFTGESFQRTSRPVRYIIDLEAKYLCRQLFLDTGKPLKAYTENENKLLGYFNKLDEDNKILLSKFSLRIHYENIYLWKSWINNSITEQLNIAKAWLRV